MPTGTISAYSVPDGADVYIDGVAIPTQYGIARTPAIIPQIPAGTHEVTFRLPGYVDDVKTVNVSQGGWASVTGILHPIKIGDANSALLVGLASVCTAPRADSRNL